MQTYHDLISRYLQHPEAKGAGGDGTGVLLPLHIIVDHIGRIRHIGKEANRVEDVQVFGLAPDTYLHYQDENARLEWTRKTIRKIPRRLVAGCTGISIRQIIRFVRGKVIPHSRNLAKLIAAAEARQIVSND